MINCYKCGAQTDLQEHHTVHRSTTCLKCYTDLRCCKMCAFYDIKSYNECREPVAERLTEKEKANFCDFFKLNIGGNKAEETKQKALDAANALFKK
jgi:hypothetical protein